MRDLGSAALMAGLALLASSAAARTRHDVIDIPPPSTSADASDQTQLSKEGEPPSNTPTNASDPLAPLDEAPPADSPSSQAWQVINWVLATHDNHDMPFMVIDKVAAQVFLFDSTGEKIAAAPALVGMTVGDESTPGVGDRELSNIPPKDRKTPAGRFVAKFGRAAGGRDVLWVDYPSAISLHPVLTIRNQHRLERLNSPTPDDNRITYGCINVPTSFYAKIVKPLFKGTTGIVYVLPETKSLNEVFLAMPPEPDAPALAQKSE